MNLHSFALILLILIMSACQEQKSQEIKETEQSATQSKRDVALMTHIREHKVNCDLKLVGVLI